MLPHKLSPAPTTFQTAAEWLGENIPAIATEITERHFLLHPELSEKYGPRGRKKCIEDAVFHLHYLAEAVAANSAKSFCDYVAWAKVMLISRGIDWRELAANLEQMARVLRGNAPPEHQPVFDSMIEVAVADLPAFPERLPGFIGPGEPFANLANAYLEALLLLDREKAIQKVLEAIEAQVSLSDLFNHVISPVQREIGRLWQQNQITVLQEHYCTATTELVIARIRKDFIGNKRLVRALALCPEDEEHSLGIKMFAELLESDGWNVTYIGGKVPERDVLKHLTSHKTELVAVSVATALNLSKMRQLITAIRQLPLVPHPSILAGGAALLSDDNLWKTMGADAFAPNLPEGLDMANKLVKSDPIDALRHSL